MTASFNGKDKRRKNEDNGEQGKEDQKNQYAKTLLEK